VNPEIYPDYERPSDKPSQRVVQAIGHTAVAGYFAQQPRKPKWLIWYLIDPIKGMIGSWRHNRRRRN